MRNHAITPAGIDKISFRIPLYQRPYAWEERQLRQLLDDFETACNTDQDQHYHIGILSVAKTADDPNRFDLIDGQQRITALMLIGITAKKIFPRWNNFLNKGRLQLYGRQTDQAYLDNADPDQDVLVACNHPMAEALRIAREYLARDSRLAEYIYNHAAFFLSEVPDHYSMLDKNQQFVRYNNRGRQLEKHQILKTKLLYRLPCEMERDQYGKSWNEMVHCLTGIAGAGEQGMKEKSLEDILSQASSLGDTEEFAGKEPLYSAIVNVPEFLLIVFARHRKKTNREMPSFNTDKLLETFESLTEPEAIRNFLDLLNLQAKLLYKYFIFICKAGNDFRYEVGLDKGKVDDTSDQKRLGSVQSFLHVSTEPHHWLVPAFDWCEKMHAEQGNVNPKDFIEELEKIDQGLLPVRRPINLEMMTYGNISRYWFYRLDYELLKLYHQKDDRWKALTDSDDKTVAKLVDNFRFRQTGSIEHINPQHPVAGDTRENLHSFGNLALISRSNNSKFSNALSGTKKELIVDSGYAESLKMVHFLWCDPNIESAGVTMCDILRKSAGIADPENRTTT